MFEKRTEIVLQDNGTSSRCLSIGDAKCTTTASGVFSTCLVHHRRSFAARASHRARSNQGTWTWTRAFMETIVECKWASRSGDRCVPLCAIQIIGGLITPGWIYQVLTMTIEDLIALAGGFYTPTAFQHT